MNDPTVSSKEILSFQPPTYPANKKARRAGWGSLPKPRTFTFRAKTTLTESAVVLESLGIEDILLLTLTLPGSTPEALDAFERYSGFAVNRFNQFLRRWLIKPLFLWCFENQSRGALHLHYAVLVPLELRARFTAQKVQEQWHRVLESICVKSGIDVFAIEGGYTWRNKPEFLRVDVQQCCYSIAKYFSKTDQKRPRIREDGSVSSPGCWSNVSRCLRELVQQKRLLEVFETISKEQAFTEIGGALFELLGGIPFELGSEREPEQVLHPITNEFLGYRLNLDRTQLDHYREILDRAAESARIRFAKEKLDKKRLKRTGTRFKKSEPQLVVFRLFATGFCKLTISNSKILAQLLTEPESETVSDNEAPLQPKLVVLDTLR